MENSKKKAALVLVSSMAVQFVSGILYIWSIVGQTLIEKNGWTSVEASLPYTVATIMMPVMMVLAGVIMRKKSPRFVATMAALALGGGLMLSSLANDPVLMVLTFGIVTATGMGFNNVAGTATPIKWFPASKKGMISGLIIGAISIASVFYSPVFNYLVGSFGLPSAFLMLGVGVIIVAVVMAQFISDPPESYVPSAERKGRHPNQASAAKEAVAERELNSKEMVKTKEFYKLWIMLAFSSAAGLMVIGHLATIAEVQANWDGGYLLIVLLAVFNLLGCLFGGAVSDKIGCIKLMRIVFILQAVNMVLFGLYTSTAALAVGVALAGFFYGSSIPAFPAATAGFFGIKNMSGNYGLVWIAWGFGGVIGPLMAGGVFDATGGYRFAYIIALAFLVVASVLTFTFQRKESPCQIKTRLK